VDPRAAAGFLAAAIAGLLIQVLILRRMQGQDLRQTMVTIGLSIVHRRSAAVDLHRPGPPDGGPRVAAGTDPRPPVINAYSKYRLSLLAFGIVIGVGLWLFLNRTRVGMMIRAGVDDRGMLAASGVNVNLVFAITFMIGPGWPASAA
jgi:branched-chain amino acid transport system permease protein